MRFAFAGDVENLYSANIAVSDRSEKELERAVGLALKAVLVKITGDAAGAGQAAVVLVDGAMSFLEQYSYLESTEQKALHLSAKFDQSILNAELTTLEIPIWGKERPDTFFGLLFDDVVGLRWFSVEDGVREIQGLFSKKADERGLPLIFPDPEKLTILPLVSLSNGQLGLSEDLLYQEMVEQYAAPSVVLVSFRRVGTEIWESSWSLRIGNDKYSWNSEGDLIDLVISEVVDSISDKISSTLLDPSVVLEPQEIDIEVIGLNRSTDFLKVLSYLSGLDSVNAVSVTSLRMQKVMLTVSTLRSRRELLQSIAFGKFLNLVSDNPITYDLNVMN
ncbi:MAG: DUF2066 domain-containing protein [Pseudomonadota bacterium]|nr:DUF2066 domain-containing protein [Pseudomonadota bacterium]